MIPFWLPLVKSGRDWWTAPDAGHGLLLASLSLRPRRRAVHDAALDAWCGGRSSVWRGTLDADDVFHLTVEAAQALVPSLATALPEWGGRS